MQTSPEEEPPQHMVSNPISDFLTKLASQTTEEKKQPKEDTSLWVTVIDNSDDEDMSIASLMTEEEPTSEEDHHDVCMAEPSDDPIVEDADEIPRAQENQSPRPSSDPNFGFTLDKVPPSEWRDKIFEMHAWCTSELLQPGATVASVINKFVTKLHGRLRQWWISLGEYRQLQVKQLPNIDSLIIVIHKEFLGNWDHYTSQIREEFLAMKCCSFKRKDLQKHYDRMSKRYYALNGIDDVNLKQAFLNSLPDLPFTTAVQRLLLCSR